MNTIQLWLAPLLLGSIFGVTACLRVPIRWSLGYLIQHLFIGVIALLGFFAGHAVLWALIGWVFFLIFNVGRRTLVGSIGNNLAALRTNAALKQIKWLKLLSWGPPGRYWQDLVTMLDFYAKEDIVSAEAIAARWNDFPLPVPMRDTLTAYSLTGTLMNRDWKGVLEKYTTAIAQHSLDEISKPKEARFPAQAAISACRAYCELSQFDKSVECLEAADLPGNFHQPEALETIFLSFYSLTGAEKDLDELLSQMPARGGSVPEYGRVYWRARCAAVRGAFQDAIVEFDKCLSLLPANDESWRHRVLYQRKRVALAAEANLIEVPQPPPAASIKNGERSGSITSRLDDQPVVPLVTGAANEDLLARARNLQARAMVVGNIMDSGRRGPAVRGLVIVLGTIFLFGLVARLLQNKTLFDFYIYVFTSGYLREDLVLAGQWWRVVTYLLLHANLSHLFMNVFGLVWLGKHVENVYGPGRFLIIFFGAGILSGIAQMLLTPNDHAVGASGAVMGIFGASAAATLRLKNVLPAKLRKSELRWMAGLAIMQIGFDQLVNLVSVFHDKGEAVRIASWAHAGGMLAGFVLGYCLPLKPFTSEKPEISSTPI